MSQMFKNSKSNAKVHKVKCLVPLDNLLMWYIITFKFYGQEIVLQIPASRSQGQKFCNTNKKALLQEIFMWNIIATESYDLCKSFKNIGQTLRLRLQGQQFWYQQRGLIINSHVRYQNPWYMLFKSLCLG
jgi:hypothetical protein